jgi:hypothetical protein
MKKPMILATKIARSLGMLESWANVQTIRLAIQCEANYSGVSLEDAAEVILTAAKEWTRGSGYSCPPEWERREDFRLNSVDRFWFEDARWRSKAAYILFRSRIEESCQPRF